MPPSGTNICTKEQICAGNPLIVSWEADPSSSNTLYNWQQSMDLTCVDSWRISALGTFYFIGWCSTLLWLPAMADRHGRKRFYWLGIFLNLCIYTGMLFTDSLLVMTVLFSLFGAVCSLIIQVGYVYLTEMVPTKIVAGLTSLWSIQDATIYICCVVYFAEISKHWFYYALIGYILNVISMVGLYWLPESPRFLHKSGKESEAQEVIEKIARWNLSGKKRKRRASGEEHVNTTVGSDDEGANGVIEVLEIRGFTEEVQEAEVRAWLY